MTSSSAESNSAKILSFVGKVKNLVVSVTPDDSLTIRELFVPLAPTIRNSFFRFSNVTLNIEDVVGQIAQATDGDDLLFAQADLNGGAGNDILIGTRQVNNYTFGRGSGHDLIKEQDRTSGSANEIDTLTLEGLNQDDVSFARDPVDPLSIVITIKDTGETLTLDGTPFDDFDIVDDEGAHWIERVIFSDGSEISQRDIEQLILDAERTDGADTLYNFGAARVSFGSPNGAVLDGGAGDDTYINPFDDIFVRMTSGQGKDTIVNDRAFSQSVWVELDGIDVSSLARFVETRAGQTIQILRATTGEELLLTGAAAENSNFLVRADDGSYEFVSLSGALIDNNTPTDEIDFLNGPQLFQNVGEGASIPIPSDEEFTPGAGDDFVFGRGGNDTVFLNLGDGRDTLVGDSSFTVRLGDGFNASDFSVEWLGDGTDRVVLSFNNLGDGVVVNAASIEQLIYADGTVF